MSTRHGDVPPDAGGNEGDGPILSGDAAFRLLVDAVSDYAIFLLDPNGTVLTWNLGAERIKGYQSDEIIGRHFSQFYTPEDRASGRPQMLLERAARTGRYEDEGWRVRKDGTRFWADVVITALQERPGSTPRAFVKITRDLTERRAAEEQQRTLEAERRARAAAEEALAVRDRFLSVASHELKTPVASLQISAEALLRAHERDEIDPERLERGLRRIGSAAERLGELVAELLDVSQLAAQPRELRRVQADLGALTREVAARFSDIAVPDQIRVSGPESIVMQVDPLRLDQVVSNLIDNALKYSGPDEAIEIELVDVGHEVKISVIDRGIGIDPADHDRLFQAFGRGSNAQHLPGIGLGLYISQEIAGRHGGRIDARTRDDGPGSVFTVSLPRPDDRQ